MSARVPKTFSNAQRTTLVPVLDNSFEPKNEQHNNLQRNLLFIYAIFKLAFFFPIIPLCSVDNWANIQTVSVCANENRTRQQQNIIN